MGETVGMTTLRTAVCASAVTLALLASAAPAQAVVEPAGEQAASTGVPGLRADWQERMLVQLNAVRTRAGSPPVRMCVALTRSAEAYASELSRDDRFSHTGSDGRNVIQRIAASGYRPVLVGENLAAGQPTVAQAVGDWRRSLSHYATMTDPRFRHVGFGYQQGRSPKYATFWVQHFGSGGPCG